MHMIFYHFHFCYCGQFLICILSSVTCIYFLFLFSHCLAVTKHPAFFNSFAILSQSVLWDLASENSFSDFILAWKKQLSLFLIPHFWQFFLTTCKRRYYHKRNQQPACFKHNFGTKCSQSCLSLLTLASFKLKWSGFMQRQLWHLCETYLSWGMCNVIVCNIYTNLCANTTFLLPSGIVILPSRMSVQYYFPSVFFWLLNYYQKLHPNRLYHTPINFFKQNL